MNPTVQESEVEAAEKRLRHDVSISASEPVRDVVTDILAVCNELVSLRSALAAANDKLYPANRTIVDPDSAWTLEEALEMHRRKSEALIKAEAALAAREADTKRLDWLEANRADIQWGEGADSLREAIAAAMSSSPTKQE